MAPIFHSSFYPQSLQYDPATALIKMWSLYLYSLNLIWSYGLHWPKEYARKCSVLISSLGLKRSCILQSPLDYRLFHENNPRNLLRMRDPLKEKWVRCTAVMLDSPTPSLILNLVLNTREKRKMCPGDILHSSLLWLHHLSAPCSCNSEGSLSLSILSFAHSLQLNLYFEETKLYYYRGNRFQQDVITNVVFPSDLWNKNFR